MSRVGAALVGAVTYLFGCTYYNTLYNSERLYQDAERDRLAGRDSLAAARYREVVRKTADAYRSRPEDERSAEILFLLGRAQLRAGDARAATVALDEAARRATRPGLRPQVLVFKAAADAQLGRLDAARAGLEEAMRDGLGGEALAEAHLLRGTLGVEAALSDAAWADLVAAGADAGVAIDAGLERLRLAVEHGDRERARTALSALMAQRAAGVRLDSIARLLDAASLRWGPATAARLFMAADSARWEQPHRGRARLAHAKLLHAAMDSVGARERATLVASGRGEAAAEARILLASWRLEAARDLGGAPALRALLLPASGDVRADALLDALDALERYAGMGLDEPLGWFAAAEVARDRLGAPVLARGFFLAYADYDPSDPWAPKALLAALDVSPDLADGDWLRGRLEAYVGSPYVLAARGSPPAGLEDLEEELRLRLQEITAR